MRTLVLLSTLALSSPTLALAGPDADVDPNTCATTEQVEALTRFQERLAAAPDVQTARKKAKRKLRRAKGALEHASAIRPNDESLRDGIERFEEMDARIDAAATPNEVAQSFALGQSKAGTNMDCDLTTGETVATVLGFILGILPGVILLVLLC